MRSRTIWGELVGALVEQAGVVGGLAVVGDGDQVRRDEAVEPGVDRDAVPAAVEVRPSGAASPFSPK
jgi:hypothetical protein